MKFIDSKSLDSIIVYADDIEIIDEPENPIINQVFNK